MTSMNNELLLLNETDSYSSVDLIWIDWNYDQINWSDKTSLYTQDLLTYEKQKC